MAGDDFKYQTQVRITEFIEKEIRDLLNRPTNKFQSPNWDQAMRLFLEVVVPCGLVFSAYREMHQLAKEILQKAKDNNALVVYSNRDDLHKNIFGKTQHDYEFLHNTEIRSNKKKIEDWLKKYKDWVE